VTPGQYVVYDVVNLPRGPVSIRVYKCFDGAGDGVSQRRDDNPIWSYRRYRMRAVHHAFDTP
jgi:hypothetical protein